MTDKSKQEMEFLVTTEGLLFQDENVKKFYLIIKYFILDLLENIWNIYSDNLDEYKLLIEEYTKDELNSIFNQLIKKFPKLNDDFIYIIDLYKKFIYKDEPIFIKSPDISNFLKCFLKKLIPIKQIQNGSYFSFHSIEQDFILRDIFRQTLFMDCLEIDNEKPKPTELLPVFETKKEDSIVLFTIKETIIEKESEKQIETILKTPLETPSEILKEKCQEKIEDILPLQTTIPCEDDKLDTKIDDFVLSDNESITEDDSISRVMEKMYLNTLQDQPKKKIKKIILT
jgi:hypothetical protein